MTLDDGRLRLHSINELAGRVLHSTNPDGATVIAKETESLSTLYADLNSKSISGKENINKSLNQVKDFNKLQEVTQDWIRATELRLKSGKGPKRDLAEKRGHLQKSKVFCIDILKNIGWDPFCKKRSSRSIPVLNP